MTPPDNATSSFCTRTADGCVLKLKISPRASRDEIGEVVGDALKVRLKAPPVDGKANASLLKFLRKQLKTRASDLELISGHSSRSKQIRIRELGPETVLQRLPPRDAKRT